MYLQCMNNGIALTQACYLEKEEKYLPPPRLVKFRDYFFLCSLHERAYYNNSPFLL